MSKFIFCCTVGRGTEQFVEKELKQKLDTVDDIQIADGRIYFKAGSAEAHKLTTLKTVERVVFIIQKHEYQQSCHMRGCLDVLGDIEDWLYHRSLWRSIEHRLHWAHVFLNDHKYTTEPSKCNQETDSKINTAGIDDKAIATNCNVTEEHKELKSDICQKQSEQELQTVSKQSNEDVNCFKASSLECHECPVVKEPDVGATRNVALDMERNKVSESGSMKGNENLQPTESGSMKVNENLQPTESGSMKVNENLQPTESGSMKVNENLQPTESGSMKVNENLQPTESGSMKVNENLQPTESGSMKVNENLQPTESGSMKVNENLQPTESGSMKGNENLQPTESGSMKVNENLQPTAAHDVVGSMKVNENLQPTESGSMKGNENLQPTESGSMKVNENLQPTESGSMKVNENLQPTESGLMKVNENLQPTESGSMKGNENLQPTESGSMEVNENLQPTESGSMKVNENLQPTESGSMKVNENLQLTESGSMEVNENLQPTESGSMKVNENLQPTESGSMKVNENLQPTESGSMKVNENLQPTESGSMKVNENLQPTESGSMKVNENLQPTAAHDVVGSMEVNENLQPTEAHENLQPTESGSMEVNENLQPTESGSMKVNENLQHTEVNDIAENLQPTEAHGVAENLQPTEAHDVAADRFNVSNEQKSEDIHKNPTADGRELGTESSSITLMETDDNNLHVSKNDVEMKEDKTEEKEKTEEKKREKFTGSIRINCKCSARASRWIPAMNLQRNLGSWMKRKLKWETDLKKPDIELSIRFHDEQFYIGIPLTREPVSKREYIKHFGLRGTIAYIMSSLLPIKDGDVVVDPMCGKATILVESAHQYRRVMYLGCDTDDNQLQFGVENIIHAQLDNVCLFKGNVLNLSLKDSSVDHIICDAPFGIKHCIDGDSTVFYSKFITEMSRVLKPGGKIVLLTSNVFRKFLKINLNKEKLASLSQRERRKFLNFHVSSPKKARYCHHGSENYVHDSSESDDYDSNRQHGHCMCEKGSSSFSLNVPLQFVNSFYVKLGETDAYICEIIKHT